MLLTVNPTIVLRKARQHVDGLLAKWMVRPGPVTAPVLLHSQEARTASVIKVGKVPEEDVGCVNERHYQLLAEGLAASLLGRRRRGGGGGGTERTGDEQVCNSYSKHGPAHFRSQRSAVPAVADREAA